jgi:hypothetical protein
MIGNETNPEQRFNLSAPDGLPGHAPEGPAVISQHAYAMFATQRMSDNVISARTEVL